MYNGMKVLDVHSHVRVPLASGSYLKRLLASNTASVSPIAPGLEFAGDYVYDLGMKDEDFRQAAEKHASYLDRLNIDVQILGPHVVDVNGWMAPHIFRSWTSFINDTIFKICQAKPDRWVGACVLPQLATEPDTQHVLPELERCVQDYGFAATYVSPDISGRRDSPGMSEPYWYPLYERCEAWGIPIIVHGTDGQDPRLRSVPHNFQLAFMSEQYFALQLLRFSDVFDRFPGLRVLICHCGGALDRFSKESPVVGPRNADLSENLFFDTCAYDLDFLTAAIKQRGISQMCFGAEAPGMGSSTIRPDTGRPCDDLVPVIGDHPALSFLSEANKEDIFFNNPAKFCPALASPIEINARAKVPAYSE